MDETLKRIQDETMAAIRASQIERQMELESASFVDMIWLHEYKKAKASEAASKGLQSGAKAKGYVRPWNGFKAAHGRPWRGRERPDVLNKRDWGLVR